MGDKLEIGVPLDRGHKVIMVMAEDKPPQTGPVNLPGADPKVWAQGRVGKAAGAIPMTVHLKPRHTRPNRKCTLSVRRPCWALPLLYRAQMMRAFLDHANQPVILPFSQ